MRVLSYFPAQALVDRGTPLRARNLSAALARQPGVQLRLLSRDDPGEVEQRLGLESLQLLPRQEPLLRLQEEVQNFRPQAILGHTHRALYQLAEPGAWSCLTRVVDLHGHHAVEALEKKDRPLPRRLFNALRRTVQERRALPKVDGLTAVCEALARRLRSAGRPVRVLWGGVDPEHFQPAAEKREDEGQTLSVAYAGNFRPYQGVQTLIEAVASLQPRWQLWLVGDLAAEPEMQRLAKDALGEDGLRSFGRVSYERVPEILGQADALAIPRLPHRTSRYGFPSKLPEYLALGRPVLVSDVGELPRVVQHGKTGLVARAGDSADLARALRSLEDCEQRHKLGRAGRQLAATELHWNHLGGEVLSFLRELRATRTTESSDAKARPRAHSG